MKKLTIVLFLLAGVARADEFPKTIAALHAAYLSDDAAAMKTSIAALKAMPSTPRVAYAIGYGERQLAFLHATPKGERAALLADAAARFEEVIRAEPKNAEAYALLSSCRGGMIAFAPMRAMELGPAASRDMQKALALQPNNPRVLLLAGISALKKPAEFGGGADVAEPLLRRAASIFAQEPADRPWPNWGRFESHMWLGQLLDKLGKRDAARTEYEAALAIAPRSQWARAILQGNAK